jgi:hypothetical protein
MIERPDLGCVGGDSPLWADVNPVTTDRRRQVVSCVRDCDVNPTAAEQRELDVQARRIVAGNKYLTLSTADAAGRPWASPVYFTPEGDDRFLWVSSPGARHSLNIAARPEVAFAIFDSTVPIGHGEAVYVSARAALVPAAELEQSAGVFAARFPELAGFTARELRPPAPLRLYRAVASECSVLLRGADPRNPTGIDARVLVNLASDR